MAEIPKKIDIGPGNYTVEHSAEGILRYEVENAVCVGGHYNHGLTLMRINPVRSPSRQRTDLTHECTHGIIDEWDMGGLFRDDCVETFVTRFAPALVDLLRRNPQLVAFLTEAEDG